MLERKGRTVSGWHTGQGNGPGGRGAALTPAAIDKISSTPGPVPSAFYQLCGRRACYPGRPCHCRATAPAAWTEAQKKEEINTMPHGRGLRKRPAGKPRPATTGPRCGLAGRRRHQYLLRPRQGPPQEPAPTGSCGHADGGPTHAICCQWPVAPCSPPPAPAPASASVPACLCVTPA